LLGIFGKSKKTVLILGISALLLAVAFLLNTPFKVTNTDSFEEQSDDFHVAYEGTAFHVIVEKPDDINQPYPLVIYNHGGGYKTFEPFELRKIAETLSEAGFIVWIPERSFLKLEALDDSLEEAKGISELMLDTAYNNPMIDKENIHIAGFSLGSWAILEANLFSPVKTIILIGFGAPFQDTRMYDRIHDFVKNADYDKVSANVLVVVSKEDTMVYTEPAEILRKKMLAANKPITCIEYPTGGHSSLTGNKTYLIDIIKYLTGEEIETTDIIETNKGILDKWDEMRAQGYWE